MRGAALLLPGVCAQLYSDLILASLKTWLPRAKYTRRIAITCRLLKPAAWDHLQPLKLTGYSQRQKETLSGKPQNGAGMVPASGDHGVPSTLP